MITVGTQGPREGERLILRNEALFSRKIIGIPVHFKLEAHAKGDFKATSLLFIAKFN